MVEIGERWAYREKPRTVGVPVRPVDVLQLGPPRSKKVRIRWLDGEYPGLDEWVPAGRLVVPWEEVEDFRRDEHNLLQLEASQPHPVDAVTAEAVRQVSASLEGPVWFDVQTGRPLSAQVEDFEKEAAGLSVEGSELLASKAAYIDSEGALHVGQDAAVLLARRYCEAHPERVLGYSKDELERVRQAVLTGWYEPRWERIEPWRVRPEKAKEWLAKLEAAWSTICDWCGQASVADFNEREALMAEVVRLRDLLTDTARWLKDAGHPQKAASLLRTLRQPVPGGPNTTTSL